MSGCYLLLILLPRRQRITVGHLGVFDFPAGFYLYTGSALRGLESRIARHLRLHKKKHWHIDYLLEEACVLEAIQFPTTKRLECLLNARAAALPGAQIVVPRFGSSDCRCRAHLWYFEERPEVEIPETMDDPGLSPYGME